jgi:hypothetical protein
MKLTFWLEGLQADPNVDILVEGLRYPYSAWQKRRSTTGERVLLTAEGLAQTAMTWARLDRITIRNLPAGARLACWHAPFDLPAAADTERPYTHYRFRDKYFNRYWQIKDKQLWET